ncbi:MAG TPA: 2Fe-2S iron-sulfur cluster-binding protein [Steroidobacteraceae bacterium]|nr:2Fe-2S iron-sulfur cluster-binding protein [Steroidobacteraceae bacterium]
MTRVTCIEPDGNSVSVDIRDGWSLMQGAKSQGVEGIEAQCGGACSCATCHCYVDPAWIARLPAPGEAEALMLTNVAAEQRPNSRLSCQICIEPALEGLVVAFPERQS